MLPQPRGGLSAKRWGRLRAGLSQRNARAPTTGWIATAHGVDEAVETSDIFAEFGEMPQFTLHSLDMTVEVMRTSACAALLPARYAERSHTLMSWSIS